MSSIANVNDRCHQPHEHPTPAPDDGSLQPDGRTRVPEREPQTGWGSGQDVDGSGMDGQGQLESIDYPINRSLLSSTGGGGTAWRSSSVIIKSRLRDLSIMALGRNQPGRNNHKRERETHPGLTRQNASGLALNSNWMLPTATGR